MWFDNTPFEEKEEIAMHGQGWSNVFEPKRVYMDRSDKPKYDNHIIGTDAHKNAVATHKTDMECIAKMAGATMTPTMLESKPMFSIDSITKEAIPAKYAPPAHWCEHKGWISKWRFEQKFEEIYPVQWEGFESNTQELFDMGWSIMLEYNRFTKTRKLCFRNPVSGLTARVPFEFNMPYIQLDKLYATKNYRLKAAKFTEVVAGFTEDMIPDMLEYIREVTSAKVSEYVWEKHKEKAKNKVIELGQYIKNRKLAA